MIPEEDDTPTIPQQRMPTSPPRIALADVLFDRPRSHRHRDTIDALAALALQDTGDCC
ncbi:hypothetical protein [Streptomyces sp900116325]|uniref:hypothetical protein n=1 Tax=Streptomyces sp. 900116325 TaxID=3154295 RepID=UPI0033F443FE